MININISSQDLDSICKILSNLNILSHSKIDKFLQMCRIENLGIEGKQITKNGIPYYTMGDSKKDKLYKSFVNHIQKTNNANCIIVFLETVFDPINYTNDIEGYNEARDNINKVLLLKGLEITNQGKIINVKQANSLEEVEERVNKLKRDLKVRNVHKFVEKYSRREYLSKDFFHATFEGVKGIFQRIRELTNRTTDGQALLDEVFSKQKPLLVFNNLATETDYNEFIGLKDLILSLHKMVRNPNAHTPRLLSETEYDECLDIFVLISRVHKYLDKCNATCFV